MKRAWNRFLAALVLLAAISFVSSAQNFQWNWREAQYAKRTLRQSKLGTTETASLASAIADQIRPEMDNYGITSEQQLRRMVMDTLVARIDLNGDKTPEVIVQGGVGSGCSPTGNCSFWILQKVANRYKLLLSAYSVGTFTLQPEFANGFRDIVLSMHGSAYDQGLTLYRYEGGKYHNVACYEATWRLLEGEREIFLKEPRITACNSQ